MANPIFLVLTSLALLSIASVDANAGVNWPSGQLLPSLSTPAKTLDLISNANDGTPDAHASAVLFSTLKGLVNRTKPRIYDGDKNNIDGGTWLNDLGLKYRVVDDRWSLITKYRSEIKGVVVYDDAQPDTLNLASTIAAADDAIVAAPLYVDKLTSAPYNLPILSDLRGKYADKLSVYQDLYDHYWPKSTHRVIVGLNPTAVYGNVREWAEAINSAVIWLDPRVPAEKPLLDKFLSSMEPGSVYMGWWPEEGSGVGEASTYGVATCASDWSNNLSVFAGTSRRIAIKGTPAPPTIENKKYVSFIVSDGDNLQYIEGAFRNLWRDPNRGQVPIGWTLSPAMVDVMPGILNSLYRQATPNDCLLSGPSGYGYTYPNYWKNQDYLNAFITKSNEYCAKAGFRIITIWNTILGGIDPGVGEAYAKHAPSLLGLTAMNAGAPVSVYGGTLPSKPLSATYCPTEESVKREIAGASANWDGQSPRFIMIQVQPWGDVTPTKLVDVAKSLGPDYVLVRPDVMFEMIREANGLPAIPPK